MLLTKRVTFFCIILNIISIFLIIGLKNNLPPLIPLFYGLPVSPNQLVPSQSLIIPSIISICLCIINLTFAKFIKDTFLEKMVAGLNITITILPLITIIEIIFLVGNL